jgi:pyruvate kinase
MKFCTAQVVFASSFPLTAQAFNNGFPLKGTFVKKSTVLESSAADYAYLSTATPMSTSQPAATASSLATSGPPDVLNRNLPLVVEEASYAGNGAPIDKVAQRWRKKTKQVATLGPASSTVEMIETLFLAGADVFRLNFSHGSQEQKKELLDMIRQVEHKYSHPITVLGDLQGPKLRVGEFANPDGEFLTQGQTFRFDLSDEKGDNFRVKLPHPEIIEASEVGHVLLIDDGKMKLTVSGKGYGYIDCAVNVEGKIKDRKGVNTPDSILEISPLTPKDRSDLEYMLKIGVDWVALSFVQRPQDIVEINKLIDQHLPAKMFRPAVMAKIEKPSCFFDDNLEKIVELCQGIMVARGDLGVECAPEDVPLLQKQIIDECREQGKPVVVATQMLESMIESPTPTRAETSDVATAIYDGADAIMLSAESAAGKVSGCFCLCVLVCLFFLNSQTCFYLLLCSTRRNQF